MPWRSAAPGWRCRRAASSSSRALQIGGALLLPCDSTDVASLATARQALIEAWGGVDLVVYLAGDYVPMRADTFDLAAIERVVEVNFNGALRLVATVLPDLHAGGGIALVASVAGYRGLPNALAYGPGKAALIHLAECLHLDLRIQGIGVWLINPGFVATRLTAQNQFEMPALLTPERAAQDIIEGLGSGRFEIHFPKRFTRFLKLMSHLPYRWYFPLIARFTRS